ncbi:nucleoporin Ndc1 [Aphis craccivora]|uniref:Nucleoporin Ndc1 n=1 Tax=Aphis craccivora TaxID=307492 RepID=A0A6G0Z0I1_APHCR|nr:nucleoporin Ndc1 [Aphis craccivora]
MTSTSNIFLTKTLKSTFSSLLLTYVTAFLLSLRSILSFTFSLYSLFYVPTVLVAVLLFIITSSRRYVKTDVPCSNRFSKIVKGLSIQTILLASMFSVSAWFLSSLNPFCHDDKIWHLLNIGCALSGILFHYENVYFEQDFHFPIIHTTKYSMFMSKLSEIIFKSLKKSCLYIFFIFIPLYVIEPKLCTDFYFFVTLWFSISLVLYFFYSFEYIIFLTMTERVIFPIVNIKQNDNCLLNALNVDNKIIKSLALFDLYQATIKDPERRKEIFSLSFAGNVSQSWKMIFNYCMNNIKSTTEDMKNVVNHIPLKLINRRNITNARLIHINDKVNSKPSEENLNQHRKLLCFVEKFWFYKYFFGPLDKDKLLEELETTVWCCYILSNLAVVSLKEDEYGIVREQLGQIVSTILDLKNQLDIQQRSLNNQKTKKIEYLKTHVKTCAVMLALNFGMYANDIGLDETHLHSFKKIIVLLNNC